MQPAIEEHRAMPGREHEPVAVEPAGFGWIILEAVPEKD
jgi:hypothetical protein